MVDDHASAEAIGGPIDAEFISAGWSQIRHAGWDDPRHGPVRRWAGDERVRGARSEPALADGDGRRSPTEMVSGPVHLRWRPADVPGDDPYRIRIEGHEG